MLLANFSHVSPNTGNSANSRTPACISWRNCSSEYSERAKATMRVFSGRRPLRHKLNSAGMSFRRVRSPVAPMITMEVVWSAITFTCHRLRWESARSLPLGQPSPRARQTGCAWPPIAGPRRAAPAGSGTALAAKG